MKQKKKNDNFIMIPHWYFECGLDLIEVNLIGRVASWQRVNKEFHESKAHIAKIFLCSEKTISRKFKGLVEKGILIEEVRKGTTTKYKVNINKLNECKTLDSESLVDQIPETLGLACMDSESRDKNTKNINNNILREEEEPFVGSSLLKMKDIDIELFARSLDI